MKSIETKYHGPTNTRGSRISATDGDNRVSVPYESAWNSEYNHKLAAEVLRSKLGWTGKMVGGHTKSGMVWVFVDGGEDYVIE